MGLLARLGYVVYLLSFAVALALMIWAVAGWVEGSWEAAEQTVALIMAAALLLTGRATHYVLAGD